MFAKLTGYAFKPLSGIKKLVPAPLHCCKILLAALTIVGATEARATEPNKNVFSEGHWNGWAMAGTAVPGCIMAMQLDDMTGLAVFATSDGDFDLAFSSNSWNITEPEENLKAYLELDGEPVTFTRIFLPIPSTILIRAVTPEDIQKLEYLIRKAEDMKVKFDSVDYTAHISFYDNHLAVSALKNCVKAEARKAKQAQGNP